MPASSRRRHSSRSSASSSRRARGRSSGSGGRKKSARPRRTSTPRVKTRGYVPAGSKRTSGVPYHPSNKITVYRRDGTVDHVTSAAATATYHQAAQEAGRRITERRAVGRLRRYLRTGRKG